MRHKHQRKHVAVYPKKYAHGFCFAVLCCGCTLTDFPISIRLTSLALWQSNDCPSASKATLMNMDKYFMWINYERLRNHNKAKHNKTVCIFLGIYCRTIQQSTSHGIKRHTVDCNQQDRSIDLCSYFAMITLIIVVSQILTLPNIYHIYHTFMNDSYLQPYLEQKRFGRLHLYKSHISGFPWSCTYIYKTSFRNKNKYEKDSNLLLNILY